jgi:guanyl-specific ribonuclease Sa
MRRVQWLMLALLVTLALLAMRQRFGGEVAMAETPAPVVVATTPVADEAPVANEGAAAADADLPPEARATLARIAAGGPFPYERDGIEFRNFEHRLPERARGWYHEYTVETPGVDHRGARRIVTGGQPPSEWWYTDDHYATFRRISP